MTRKSIVSGVVNRQLWVRSWVLRFVTATVVFTWFEDRVTYACSAPTCTDGEVFPTEGVMPANAVVVFARPSVFQGWADVDAGGVSDGIELRVIDADGQTRDVEFEEIALDQEEATGEMRATFKWVPKVPLQEGDRITLEYTDGCSGDTEVNELAVVAPAETPNALGTLRVDYYTKELELWSGSAACTDSVLARYADVTVSPSETAEPFAALLRYELWVDGEPFESEDWPSYVDGFTWGAGRNIGGSRLGRGVERVFTVCEPTDADVLGGVAPGKHQIQVKAYLPNGSSITSEERQIELHCPKTATAPPSSEVVGCHMGGGHAARTGLFASLFAGLALLRRRSRNERASRFFARSRTKNVGE